jgi:DNA gyrase subunit A
MKKEITDNIAQIIEEDVKDSLEKRFLDYSMSVLISRAIPNFNDGFKVVHRRILWSMHEEKFKTLTKVAKIGGSVLGNYHAHGNQEVNS